MGQNGVESGKTTCADSCTRIPIFQGYSTDDATIQGLGENPQIAGAGLEPALPYGKGILNP